MKLAIIGYGAIARLALETIAVETPSQIDSLIVLARPQGQQRAASMLKAIGPGLAVRTHIVANADDLLAQRPDLVLEAAGHEALNAFAARILSSGAPLIVASVGALADDTLQASLDAAAEAGRTRYEIIPGAVGGLDILAAAKLSGLTQVLYKSRKPPAAWRNTAAEAMTQLDAVTQETIFFHGHAGEAARLFPQNANVAATIALKGAGFEATEVQLIADPEATRNIHELSVVAGSADFSIRIEGRPAPDNPKTSLTTAYSLARKAIDYMQLIQR